MPADMGIEKVNGFEAFPAHLGVEIQAAGLETPIFRTVSMTWVVR